MIWTLVRRRSRLHRMDCQAIGQQILCAWNVLNLNGSEPTAQVLDEIMEDFELTIADLVSALQLSDKQLAIRPDEYRLAP